VLKKNFVFGKEFYTDKIKEGKPTWFRRLNRVQKEVKKILFFEVLFSW